MNERLLQKIDKIKKTLKDENDFHPFLCFDPNPIKFEVELSASYKKGAKYLLEFIEDRENAIKVLPLMTPADSKIARQTIAELSDAIDKLEIELEKEYKKLAAEQRFDQELYEATYLQNQISREHFIMVKHLKPHIFEKFKEWVFKNMTEEEIAEEMEIIQRREREELDAILAADIVEPEFVNPHIRRQSPYDLFARYMLYLNNYAYETDEHFKDTYKTIEFGEETKRKLTMQMFRVLPAARRRLDADIRKLEPSIRQLVKYLNNYHRQNKEEGNFNEDESADEKKIDEFLARLDDYRAEIFLHIKNKKPQIFADYEKVVCEDMTNEEIEEFYKKVAEYEENKLDIILRAVEEEIH